MLARDAGLSEEENEKLLRGEALEDVRLEALRLFTVEMVDKRGQVAERVWEDFLKAGWERKQGLEVVMAVGMKVMSNFTNALAGVPLEEGVG